VAKTKFGLFKTYFTKLLAY